MTIGIYSLYWEDQDLIYIGQSQNIERRYKDHLIKLSAKTHTNYKVQDTYNKYGKPTFNIIEICNIDRLDELEIFWTNEFNSLNTPHGLNIVPAGSYNEGTLNINSKYSRLQILLSFRALYNTKLTYASIYKLYGIKISNLNLIFSGKIHVWLQEKYPNSYIKMQNNSGRGIYTSKVIKTVDNAIKLISPEGEIISVLSTMREFAKKYNLHAGHLSEVKNGTRKIYKGWKLYQA